MKRKLTILLALLGFTGMFVWSHYYYTDKHIEIRDKVTVMEYKVLDKKTWSLEGKAKEAALAEDVSYEEIARLKQESQAALNRSKIGKWISLIGIVASGLYLLYFLWFAVYVELIKNRGYETIVAYVKKMAEKMEASAALPKEEKDKKG